MNIVFIEEQIDPGVRNLILMGLRLGKGSIVVIDKYDDY